ncbi:MAG: hypothetical protein ACMUHB_03485 [Thermoplasmatota archaeon]
MNMDMKRSLTLLSMISMVCLLAILVSSFFIEMTIFEIGLATVILSLFAARAHFRKRIKGIYLISLTNQIIVLLFLAVFIMMIPSIGIVSIAALILTIYSAANKDERKVIIAETLLLSTLVLISVLYIINFPLPME